MKNPFQFKSAAELLRLTQKYRVPISEIAIRHEMRNSGRPRRDIMKQMEKVRSTMKDAIERGVRSREKAFLKLAGGDAYKMFQALKKRKPMLHNPLTLRAMAYAIATGEQNACMGRIAAFPTAGGAGVFPGTSFAYFEEKRISEKRHYSGFFTASAIGILIAERATLSAAAGGCQSEVGAAVAMSAAAVTEMRGGKPSQCLDAAAIAMKSYLGLVCDPLGGLVMVPCIKRNALGCAAAFAASDLVMAGVESFVPLDDVLAAMANIADIMSPKLKETALGGLATTPTGMRVRKALKLPPLPKDAIPKRTSHTT